jgi:hypothetical protein
VILGGGDFALSRPLPSFDSPPKIVYRTQVSTPKPEIDSSDPELAKIAEVESRATAVGERARWGDGKRKHLEDLLPKCVGGILRNARSLRLEQEARKRQELEWERHWKEEQERVRKAREEQHRLENLEKCVSNWQKAEQIRAFANAYQKMCEANEEPTAPGSPKGEWISWARRKADELDPLLFGSDPNTLSP